MRKRDLMQALANPAGFPNDEPPGRAVFFHAEETTECCTILGHLMRSTMQKPARSGGPVGLPLPNVDLPMVF